MLPATLTTIIVCSFNMDFNYKYVSIYLFIVILKLVFVVLLPLQVFFCQMHCMLVTLLAAVLWKTQKETLTNGALLYLQLFTGSSVI